MKALEFGRYKNYLINYLQLKGVDVPKQGGLIRCFSPDHNDKNPSCQVTKNSFVCLSGNCGIRGDIYDAVAILEGIKGKANQYKFIDSFFFGKLKSGGKK